METNDDYYKLTYQQQRFCDEYLMHFNALKAAVNAGYSENTARKGELLHLPKIQIYLKEAMRRTQSRLQITHDMILTELAKIAFSNMGNYFDEQAVLKPMHKLTADEKAAISQYQVLDATDDYGQRVGELSKIKLHNKMAALDKIARHLGFYEKSRESGVLSRESGVLSRESEVLSRESEVLAVVKSGEEHSPADLPKGESHLTDVRENEASVSLESDEKHALTLLTGKELSLADGGENFENILTLSPLTQCLNDRLIEGLNEESLFIGEFALAIGADTGPATGPGLAVAKACAV